MDKLQAAIERVKLASKISLDYYDAPLTLGYSGGKDSDCALRVLELAGVPFEVVHNHTGVDAPQTYRHINRVFKKLELRGVKCKRNYGRYKGKMVTLFSLIPLRNVPPTRLMRYCCSTLKESYTPKGILTLGVRAAESRTRSGYKDFTLRAAKKENKHEYTAEHAKGVFADSEAVAEAMGKDKKERTVYDCVMVDAAKRNKKIMANAIVDWTDEDVWQFIEDEHLEVNPLYRQGYTRCGCIGCPLAGRMQVPEFERHPLYAVNYLKAFDRMIKIKRQKPGCENAYRGRTVEDFFWWWIQGKKGFDAVWLFEDPLKLEMFKRIFGKEDFILSDLVKYPKLIKELRIREAANSGD